MILGEFELIRPPYETNQQQTLEWLVAAHGEEYREKFWRVACKPDQIEKRGHILPDYQHSDWDKMELFRLKAPSGNPDLSARMYFYEKHVDPIFEQFYPEGELPPDDLIHVSCTGYLSPSGAQKLVSKRNWGKNTTVTHAYHMGCYGSVPALRLARGFLSAGHNRADIVHTELCSLHPNLDRHETGQFVVQSLFADGFIKYSLGKTVKAPSYRLLAIHEEIIPDSTDSMIWKAMHGGFEMTLAKEIPVFITRSLNAFLANLSELANLDIEKMKKTAHFAIHPGGPKILQYISDLLQLNSNQVKESRGVLRDYGNMSSATLPHIWQRMLPTVADGEKVISLAFGPGLTICGIVMEKCGSSL